MCLGWLGQVVTLEVEAPRGSFIKRAPDGRIDVVSPLPCPFNYGFVPGQLAGDGDPLDAIVLGPRVPRGWTGALRVWGVVDFEDEGASDPKLVCSAGPPARWQRYAVRGFFAVYVPFKRVLSRVRQRRGATWVRGIYWSDGEASVGADPSVPSR